MIGESYKDRQELLLINQILSKQKSSVLPKLWSKILWDKETKLWFVLRHDRDQYPEQFGANGIQSGDERGIRGIAVCQQQQGL